MMGFALTTLLIQYKYVVMTPAALFFGPSVSIVAGFLMRLGYVEFLPTCVFLGVGELSGDILWYWLGHHFGEGFARKFGRYFGISERSIATVKEMFQRYQNSPPVSASHPQYFSPQVSRAYHSDAT